MTPPLLQVGIAMICLILLLVLAWQSPPPAIPKDPYNEIRFERTGDGNHKQTPDDPTATKRKHLPASPTGKVMTQNEIKILLDRVLMVLRSGDALAIKEALEKLDLVFNGENHDKATGIAAILSFLESGQDAATGEGFLVGEGGLLTEATTLRVFLMDHLGSLSRAAGSSAALEVARENLSHFHSADEWAISMRNVAWLDPHSRVFLAEQTSAMLNHEEWRQTPSQGMLEAFDFIVHTGALSTVPALHSLITGDDASLARAAAVALDRMAATHALTLTTLLNQQPELFATTPLLRADLFGHADLGNPGERNQIETYLLRPDVSTEEREKLFSSLLQNGQFVSHNLVTPFTPPETPADADARLIRLTHTVNQWMADERFSRFQGELRQFGETVNRIHDEINTDLGSAPK